jgi:hypothetical protein
MNDHSMQRAICTHALMIRKLEGFFLLLSNIRKPPHNNEIPQKKIRVGDSGIVADEFELRISDFK